MSAGFRYTAIDQTGARRRGRVEAGSRQEAYGRLRAQGLSPLAVSSVTGRGGQPRAGRLGKRALTDFLTELGALVAAGVPFRHGLSVLGDSGEGRGAILARAIERELSAGHGLADALSRSLGRDGALLAALMAAGEATGDLGGALQSGAESLRQEVEVGEALAGALAYPSFILVMSLATLLIILILVVPALRPLAEQQAANSPLMLSMMFALSDGLIAGGPWIAAAGLVLLTLALAAWRLGWLVPLVETFLLDGPLAPISRPIVFGRIAAVAGALLRARVNASDAFRLAAAGAGLALARRRVDALVEKIREGLAVSAALAASAGPPPSLARLALIGEETGALGAMLARGGDLERQRALRRLRGVSAVLGPLMIVFLGVFIGMVFAGLLTGVTSLGVTE